MNCDILQRRKLARIVVFMVMVTVVAMFVPVVCVMLGNTAAVVMRRIITPFMGVPDRWRKRPPGQQRG